MTRAEFRCLECGHALASIDADCPACMPLWPLNFTTLRDGIRQTPPITGCLSAETEVGVLATHIAENTPQRAHRGGAGVFIAIAIVAVLLAVVIHGGVL